MITYKEVVADIEAIIAEKGADYVYTEDPKTAETARQDPDYTNQAENPCYYRQYDGTPGCIVGQYIAKHAPDARVREGLNAPSAIRDAGLVLEVEALRFLREIQAHQDSGQSWGDALKAAKHD